MNFVPIYMVTLIVDLEYHGLCKNFSDNAEVSIVLSRFSFLLMVPPFK